MNLIMQAFPAFLLVLCRISAFFVVAPVFSSRLFPRTIKIGLAFFVSLMVFMTIGYDTSIVADGSYVLAIIREVFAGLLIGYVAYLFFTVVQTAGGIIDLQVGFAMANVVDPMSGVSSPLFGNFKYMLMTMIFLSVNGHHYLLTAMMNSYEWLPLDNKLFQTYYGGSITEFLSRTFSDTFMLALQVSAPIIVAIFLADAGLALLARTAPQYNVFVIGIPIKLLVGLAIMILTIPGFGYLFQVLFDHMYNALERLFVLMRGT